MATTGLALNRKPLSIGAWGFIPKGHALIEQAQRQMIAPNPEYVSLVKGGRPIDDGMSPTDQLWQQSAGGILVPRAWLVDQIPVNRMVDNTADNTVEFPKWKMEFRRGQEDFCNTLLQRLRNRRGAIGQAAPGFGKTVCASYIMRKFSQRTLVMVHTEFLMGQWAERLVEGGFKSNQIGFVQQDRCEYGGNKLVTIAMIQTLLAREYEQDFYEAFGLTICDEVHRMGASTFRQTITMFNPVARLGLSATPKRKDECDIVFKSHIGQVAAIGVGDAVEPRVWRLLVQHALPDNLYQSQLQSYRRNHFTGRMAYQDDHVKIETYLTEDQNRNGEIVRLLVRAVETKRKTLLLTSRLNHLEVLKKQLLTALASRGLRTQVGFLKGGMKEEDRAVSFGCSVILGTSKFADEALDLPALDTLILANPKQDIIQPVGRILRAVEGKKQPVVIDIVDVGIGLCEGMARKRLDQYKEKNWNVTSHDQRRRV